MEGVTRREFIELVLATAAASALPFGCGSGGRFLSDAERASLARLADHVLPPDDTPGGAALGAVDYIDRLLAAFDSVPPRIHAGGPYSGRQPFADAAGLAGSTRPPNDFATFLPLNRVASAGWRLRLYGSAGVSGGGPNDAVIGPIVGWRDQFRAGLESFASAASGPIDKLDDDAVGQIWSSLPAEFTDNVTQLVLEAAFAAPEYGGNKSGGGWKLAHFEGDSQPLGYSQFDAGSGVYRERADAPLSTADPGADPEPLTDDVRQIIHAFATALGGRSS
ncbi:MAG: gluconate 2-dehydrogenase subunit 3 family protein [Polyangia bacterium]|jgi:hypothetical protein